MSKINFSMPRTITEVNNAMNLIKQEITRELYISITEMNRVPTLKTTINSRK